MFLCRNIGAIIVAALMILFAQGVRANAETNYIPVVQNGLYGYITKDGTTAIKPQFDYAEAFFEGLAVVRTTNGKWGYIGETGVFAIEPVYGHASHFGQGLGFVEKDGKFGFINKQGEMVIGPQFDGGGSFNGMLANVLAGDKWGYIGTDGKFVIEPQFDGAEDFHEGLARICTVPEGEDCFRSDHKKFGFIDKSGQWAVGPVYTNAGMAFSEGLASVTTKDGKSIFINTSGAVVLQPSPNLYTGDMFSDGLVMAMDKETGKWGYMDKEGHMAVPPQYDRALPFKNGIAPAMAGGKWGLIDTKGEWITAPAYDRVGPLR